MEPGFVGLPGGTRSLCPWGTGVFERFSAPAWTQRSGFSAECAPCGWGSRCRSRNDAPNGKTFLRAVNLLEFPAAHVEPGWRQEAIMHRGLQCQDVGSLHPNFASQAPPGCGLASSGLVSFLGKQIKSLLLFDHFWSVLPNVAHVDKEPDPYFSHPTSSLPWLAEGGSYPPVKYCCRIFQ